MKRESLGNSDRLRVAEFFSKLHCMRADGRGEHPCVNVYERMNVVKTAFRNRDRKLNNVTDKIDHDA